MNVSQYMPVHLSGACHMARWIMRQWFLMDQRASTQHCRFNRTSLGHLHCSS